MVLLSLVTTLTIIGVIMQGYNIVCVILTCVYPMIRSIKTLESEDPEEINMWLSFWCVFGVFQTVEMYIGYFLSFIPFCNLLRFVLLLYLMMPQTQSAKVIYTSVLKMILVKYKPQIEEFIARV